MEDKSGDSSGKTCHPSSTPVTNALSSTHLPSDLLLCKQSVQLCSPTTDNEKAAEFS